MSDGSILHDRERNSWVLETSAAAYAFGINEAGLLAHRYWGPRLPSTDDYPPVGNPGDWASFTGRTGRTTQEYPGYGGLRVSVSFRASVMRSRGAHAWQGQTARGQIGDNRAMSTAAIDSTLRAILAQAPGEATALIAPETERRWSYDALRAQVAALAARLAGAGIGKGDRVAIVLPNGPEIVTAFLAVVHGGAVAAPLNPAYTPDEYTFFFGDIQPRALIVPPGEAAAARATAPAGCRILEIATDAEGRFTFAGAADGLGAVAMPDPEDVALVLHTSGTTSRPKQVPLRHRNLLATARTVRATYSLSPGDVSLCVMPLFHVHGLVASTLATLLAGGTVIVPARFSAGRFWQDARRHGATWYSAVPTIHQILLARAEEDAPAAGATGLRFIRSCSSALAPAMLARMEERYGVPVLEAYGMTEAAHQMASNPLPPARHMPGSVGRATGLQIGIMDKAGTLLPAGATGEVVIRGESVTAGYHNTPEANAAAFTNGWFRTGDQGVLDDEGYLYLTGRLKEMILRGGENIAPREIDEVLLTHPAVAEAIAFGVPDEKYGEEVAAAVVLRHPATTEEILAHCRERVAAFKAPKTLYITEQIPRTATGKIQRRLVAAAFAPK